MATKEQIYNTYKDTIDKYASQHGLDPMLISAMIQKESSGNPNAESSKGAKGLMQLMPATAKEVAGKLGIENFDPTNPEHSVAAGTFYLKEQLDRFGSLPIALAAYNAGPNSSAVKSLLKGDTDINKETKDYVPAILKDTGIGSNQPVKQDADPWGFSTKNQSSSGNTNDFKKYAEDYAISITNEFNKQRANATKNIDHIMSQSLWSLGEGQDPSNSIVDNIVNKVSEQIGGLSSGYIASAAAYATGNPNAGQLYQLADESFRKGVSLSTAIGSNIEVLKDPSASPQDKASARAALRANYGPMNYGQTIYQQLTAIPQTIQQQLLMTDYATKSLLPILGQLGAGKLKGKTAEHIKAENEKLNQLGNILRNFKNLKGALETEEYETLGKTIASGLSSALSSTGTGSSGIDTSGLKTGGR